MRYAQAGWPLKALQATELLISNAIHALICHTVRCSQVASLARSSLHGGGCRSVDYVTLAVDVWLFMVLPTVYALTKSVLPISQGTIRLCEYSCRYLGKVVASDTAVFWPASFLRREAATGCHGC